MASEGRAPRPEFTLKARQQRTTNELLGICQGILADGEVNPSEVRFLHDWLYANREFRGVFPFNFLYDRVEEVIMDGVVTLDEQRELLTVLTQVVSPAPGNQQAAASRAPFCTPPPDIRFPRSEFVLTGLFAVGERWKVESLIAREGGVIGERLTKRGTNYLIVGSAASPDWKYSTYGEKVERAVRWRDVESHPIHIVAEEHFLGQLTPV